MSSQLKTPWKKVIAVFPKKNFSLNIEWEDGKRTKFKLQSLINKNDTLWRLRNPRYFCQVYVDLLGGIAWPDGEDFSPDYLKNHTH